MHAARARCPARETPASAVGDTAREPRRSACTLVRNGRVPGPRRQQRGTPVAGASGAPCLPESTRALETLRRSRRFLVLVAALARTDAYGSASRRWGGSSAVAARRRPVRAVVRPGGQSGGPPPGGGGPTGNHAVRVPARLLPWSSGTVRWRLLRRLLRWLLPLSLRLLRRVLRAVVRASAGGAAIPGMATRPPYPAYGY